MTTNAGGPERGPGTGAVSTNAVGTGVGSGASAGAAVGAGNAAGSAGSGSVGAGPGSGLRTASDTGVAVDAGTVPVPGSGEPEPRVHEAETEALAARARALLDDPELTSFDARRAIVRLLGAHHDPDTGLTRFGFWAPELAIARVAERDVALELFTALDPVDFTAPRLAVTVQRRLLPLSGVGDYRFVVAEGVRAGCRERAGAFYWLHARDEAGTDIIARDLLAHSMPYGAFAPAEVYDTVSLERGRADLAHFARPAGVPSSLLELHIPTATRGGTVADLAEVYRGIARTLAAGESLSPEQQVYASYEAIQPLPVDPTIERPGSGASFLVTDVVDEMDGTVGVLLRHPENVNWGYDNIVASSSATNPSLLASRRPDELVELAEALHALPEPIMLIYDIVYGHADNQAVEILPQRFFKGPNMYGQDLNHQDPTVRAILLEMQRRRMNSGCDGLRVDGAQDFKFYDPRSGRVEYDDDYLRAMSEVVQEIGEHSRQVFMIFEDGRPWPREDWETASTYTDVIEQQPDIYQWGPLIFAHNTPMLENFWADKWWRAEQVARIGGHWIGGCANHDTVRRGTQVDPSLPINRHLGETLPEILDTAYDNAAIDLAAYALFPGIPMDFLNATTRTPWGFMRTTDDVYGVKVMAEEALFMAWQVSDEDFAERASFARSKRHGFTSRARLSTFLLALNAAIEERGYDLDAIAVSIETPEGFRQGREGLHLFAYDWMRDVHDFCNVAHRLPRLDAGRVAFAARLRAFRAEHRWLGEDAREGDTIAMHDEGSAVYHGLRAAPDGVTRVGVVANMGGAPVTLDLAALWPDANLGASESTTLSAGASLDGATLSLAGADGALFVWVVR